MSAIINKVNGKIEIYFMDSLSKPIADYTGLKDMLLKIASFESFNKFLESDKRIQTPKN